MNRGQRERLLELASGVAKLEHELRNERAGADNKAEIRGVLGYLERARSELEKAVGRAAIAAAVAEETR